MSDDKARPKLQIVRPDDEHARALGADVGETSDPDAKPYLYFVTYQVATKGSWWYGGPVILTFGVWTETDQAIEGPQHTARLVEEYRASHQDAGIMHVGVVGFQLIDSPDW